MMKCRFCNEPNSIHCDDACDFHLQEVQNKVLEIGRRFLIQAFGMKLIPGTDRLMFQCESCNTYERCSHVFINNKGRIEIAEDENMDSRMSVLEIERLGWRKIDNKWYCSNCLVAEERDE